MFKRIIITMIFICFLASTTSADTTTEISGEYSVTGTYIDENNIKYQYFSHEFDLYAKIMNDATTLRTEIGIADKTWGDEAENDTGDEAENDTGDEFELDRAWLTHEFETGFKLEVGKMTGGVWGTMLGDKEDGYYRVKGTKSFGDTTLVGFIQKNIENGSKDPIAADNEKDDSDSISAGLIYEIGDIKLMPKIVYKNDSDAVSDKDTKGTQELTIIFAAIGKLGLVNFETEVNYIDFTTDFPGSTDYSLTTFWADANIDVGSVNTGLSLAYGTEDNGAGGLTFGNDFSPMILMDNDDGVIADLGAMVFAKLYASAEPTDKITTGFAFAYGEYGEDAHPAKGGQTGIFELDMTADYAITEALTYSAGVAYADVESKNDAIIQVEHELVFSF